MLPTILLLALAEGVVRFGGWATPVFRTIALPGEGTLLIPDNSLLWRLRPSFTGNDSGTVVATNRLGLRSPEIQPRKEGEIRILSLGESSTFGAGVSNGETYSSLLEENLRHRFPNRQVVVINGGVPAYSSTQSLRYLKQQGLELEPDILLFYHEVNDYLPSAIRNSGYSEVGVIKTDRQLLDSRYQSATRLLLEHSALLRLVRNRLALRQIESFRERPVENPLEHISLPGSPLAARIRSSAGETSGVDERAIGRRVSDEERRENLRELAHLTKVRGISLLLIHPAYQQTSRHECLLTQVSREEGVPVVDAFDPLHPGGATPSPLFLDSWHPSPAGHARLAQHLAEALAAHIEASPVPNSH